MSNTSDNATSSRAPPRSGGSGEVQSDAALAAIHLGHPQVHTVDRRLDRRGDETWLRITRTGCSTLMTSAPKSASTPAAAGPNVFCATSSTRIPAKISDTISPKDST